MFAAGQQEIAEIATGAANELVDPNDAQIAFLALKNSLDSLLHGSLDKMQTLLTQINEAFVGLLASVANNGSGDAATGSLLSALNLEPVFAQIQTTALAIGVSSEDISKIVSLINGVTGALNTPETIAATTVISYVVINSILTWGDSPPPGRPYPKGKYDPIGARVYFDKRPIQALARSLTIASRSFFFALSIAGDKLKGDETWNNNQDQRGLELAQLLTELGPTFIKSTYSIDC